jgi:aryl-alcohol dehydrogenase-like predicted oxidoreductase
VGLENPLRAGSNPANTYNRMLPQRKALTDKLAAIGRSQRAAAAEVATAWALAKGTTPIVGVTKLNMSKVWSEPAALRSLATTSRSWKRSPTPLR